MEMTALKSDCEADLSLSYRESVDIYSHVMGTGGEKHPFYLNMAVNQSEKRKFMEVELEITFEIIFETTLGKSVSSILRCLVFMNL